MLNPLGSRENASLNMDSYNITPMRCLHSRLQKFFVFVIGNVDFFFRYSLVLNRSRICVLWCDENAVSKFFMALRVLSKEFNRFRQPFLFFTCSVPTALLIETKEESPCSDNLLVTPSPTGAFHLKKKKKNFLLLQPWRKPQKLAGSPKDLKCERKEQQDYIVNFLSCRTILFSPKRFVSDARFIRGF